MFENMITIPYQIKGIKPSERKEGYVEVLMEPLDKLEYKQEQQTDNMPIKISYAKGRMHIVGKEHRPYKECLACSFASLVAPNGDVYVCVEHSLDPAWHIGGLKEESLEEKYPGQKRKTVLKALHSGNGLPCRGSCMDHEYNVIFNEPLDGYIAWHCFWISLGHFLDRNIF